MEDRVTLDGLLIKCDQDPRSVRYPSDCENARIASERLASQQVDPDVEKKRQEEFEKAREQLRLVQDKKRQEQEEKTKVDAYTLPVVPVDPVPKPAPSGSAVPPHVEAAPYMLLLGAIHAGLGLIWFAALISATRPMARLLRRPAVVRWCDRVTGGVFVGFGIGLAIQRRA